MSSSGLRVSKASSSIMSKVKEYIPQGNALRGALVVTAILFIIIAGYTTYYYFKNRNRVAYKENNDISDYNSGTGGGGGSGKDVELMRFSATWCPACKRSNPDWEKTKVEYKGKTVNGYNIVFTEIDCTHETPETDKLMNQYKIEGYPTIKLLKDGKVYDFDANPTQTNLEKFITTIVG